MIRCPRCSAVAGDDAAQCPRCGAAFVRVASPRPRAARRAPPPRSRNSWAAGVIFVICAAFVAVAGWLLVRRAEFQPPPPETADQPSPVVKAIRAETDDPSLREAVAGLADFISRQKEAGHYFRLAVRGDGTVRLQLTAEGTRAYREDPPKMLPAFLKIARLVYTAHLPDDLTRKVLFVDSRDEAVLEEAVWENGRVVFAVKGEEAPPEKP